MTERPKRTPAEVFNAIQTLNPEIQQIERSGDRITLYDKLKGQPGRTGAMSEPIRAIEIDWGDLTEYPPAPKETWEPAQWPRDWGKKCRYQAWKGSTIASGVIVGKCCGERTEFIIEDPNDAYSWVSAEMDKVEVQQEVGDEWQPMDTAPRNSTPIWALMGGERYKARRIGGKWITISSFEREARTFVWDDQNQPTAWKPYDGEDDEETPF